METRPDDLSEDAIFVRSLGARILRIVKQSTGEKVPGAREVVREMGQLFMQASKEPDPLAFLGGALGEDESPEDV